MKKFSLILFLIILIPNLIWAAAFTSKATGNWTTEGATTWNEAGHPGNGDTVSIATTHVITVDADHDIGTTTVEGTLIIGTNITATLSGALTLGNGTNKMGTLTFSGGSTLATAALSVTLNNCTVNTSGTSNTAWAKVTGSGDWVTGAVTQPRQAIAFSYISFQNTGNMTFALHDYTGPPASSSFSADHCVFVGNTNLQVGSATYTVSTIPRTFDHCDFVDLVGDGSSIILSLSGQAGAVNPSIFYIKNSVFSNSISARKHIYSIYITTGMAVDNCVFKNVGFGASTNWVPSTVSNNFFSSPDAASEAGGSSISLQAFDANSTWDGNYFFVNFSNPTSLNLGRPNAGSTVTIQNNVFDQVVAAQVGYTNILTGTLFTGDVVIKNNVSMKEGQLYAVTATTSGNVTVDNNTMLFNISTGEQTGQLWLSHLTTDITGTANVRNNIHDYYGSHYGGSLSLPGSIHLVEDDGDFDQIITVGDYNVYNGYASAIYYHLGATSCGGSGNCGVHDINASAKYLSPQRLGEGSTNNSALAKWNLRFGSGTQNDADGITYFLGLNGYRGTPNFDQGGTPITRKPADLVEWVRYGFSPTNGLLRKAGSDGNTIGAMEWQNPRRKRAM